MTAVAAVAADVAADVAAVAAVPAAKALTVVANALEPAPAGFLQRDVLPSPALAAAEELGGVAVALPRAISR